MGGKDIDVRRGVASCTIACAPQKGARQRAVDSLEEEIGCLHRAVDHIREIPLGTMLYVRALLRVQTHGAFGEMREIDLVVTPIVINDRSIRCVLWAQQSKSWETVMIEEGTRKGKIKLILRDIVRWSVWERKHAPLTVNFDFLSPAYKKMAFDV